MGMIETLVGRQLVEGCDLNGRVVVPEDEEHAREPVAESVPEAGQPGSEVLTEEVAGPSRHAVGQEIAAQEQPRRPLAFGRIQELHVAVMVPVQVGCEENARHTGAPQEVCREGAIATIAMPGHGARGSGKGQAAGAR